MSMQNFKKYTFFENYFILEFKEERLAPQGDTMQFHRTGRNEKNTVQNKYFWFLTLIQLPRLLQQHGVYFSNFRKINKYVVDAQSSGNRLKNARILLQASTD